LACSKFKNLREVGYRQDVNHPRKSFVYLYRSFISCRV